MLTYWLNLLVYSRVAVVIPDSKTKTSRVNVPVAPQEESTKDGLGQEVKYTIEYSLTVGSNEVSTPKNRLATKFSTAMSRVRKLTRPRTHPKQLGTGSRGKRSNFHT